MMASGSITAPVERTVANRIMAIAKNMYEGVAMWLRCAAIASPGDPAGRNGEKAGAPRSSRTMITEPVMAMP